MKVVTNASFQDEVLSARGPVLVKFGADWCRPCRDMDKTILSLVDEFPDVKFVSANVDHNQVHCQRFGIQRVPAFAIFGGGFIQALKMGAATRTQMIDWIKSAKP
jgi:thioredoxin 1